MTPELSVITVTHNRKAFLEKKLESLRAQSLDASRFEWIVCVNASTDDSLAFLQAASTDFHLTVVAFSEPRSISRARNACTRQAKGQVFYFSDDDCLLAPDTLTRHLNAQHARPSVFIGSIRFLPTASPQQPVDLNAPTDNWHPKHVDYWNLNGANSSVPRDVFLTVGGFDERLVHYGGEDLLLGFLLKQQGLVFRALPDAVVTHLGPNPMRARDDVKARSAGRNAGIIAGFYPELSFRLGVHPLLMWFKGLVFLTPLARVFKRLFPAGFAYERAYFMGAREVTSGRNTNHFRGEA